MATTTGAMVTGWTESVHGQTYSVAGLDVDGGEFWATVDGSPMYGALQAATLDRDAYWRITWDGMRCRAYEPEIGDAIAEAVEYLSGW